MLLSYHVQRLTSVDNSIAQGVSLQGNVKRQLIFPNIPTKPHWEQKHSNWLLVKAVLASLSCQTSPGKVRSRAQYGYLRGRKVFKQQIGFTRGILMLQRSLVHFLMPTLNHICTRKVMPWLIFFIIQMFFLPMRCAKASSSTYHARFMTWFFFLEKLWLKDGHQQDKMSTVSSLSMQFLQKVNSFALSNSDTIMTIFLADTQEMWKPIWPSSFMTSS